MLFHLMGMVLLALHNAESPRGTQGPPRLAQIWASLGDTREILCKPPARTHVVTAIWYKEEQNRTLVRIYSSSRYSAPQGRYSGDSAGGFFSLTIRDLQTNDSGVYYCFAKLGWDFRILNGSRVIVTGGSQPTTTILVPSSLEGSPRNLSSPLLCLIWGAHPAWTPISWNISGVDSLDQQTGEAMDGVGVFGLWSLRPVPPENWTPGASYTCSVTEGRNISAEFLTGAESTNTGTCTHLLYPGVPCVLTLLLATLLVLILRKRRTRGNAEEAETQIHTRGTPETDYANMPQWLAGNEGGSRWN